MKKPEFQAPPLPERNFDVETAGDATQALLTGRPTSTVRSTPKPTPPSELSSQPSLPPAKENVHRYTAWPYPSQLDKLRGAVKDYRTRHPRRKLTINDLIRGALDLVPKAGTDLDRFVERMEE